MHLFIDILICHKTHMGWHLCSGSNSDSLEVLPLCRDIHWLGYGSPVRDRKTSRKLGASHYVEVMGDTLPAKLHLTNTSGLTEVVASITDSIHGNTSARDKRALLQCVFCARFTGTVISYWHVLLCFVLNVITEITVLFAAQSFHYVYGVRPKMPLLNSKFLIYFFWSDRYTEKYD